MQVLRIGAALFLATVILLSFNSPSPTSAQSNCGIPGSPSGESVESGKSGSSTPFELDQTTGLVWGSSDMAVLLVHGAVYDAASWETQAMAFADDGFLAVSLEEIGRDNVLETVDQLVQQCGVTSVVVIGASAGASASFGALAEQPDGVTGFIVLAGTGDVTSLGTYPKLFISAADDGPASAMSEMANTAPGDENAVLLVSGSEHAQALFKGIWSDFVQSAMIGFVDAVSNGADQP